MKNKKQDFTDALEKVKSVEEISKSKVLQSQLNKIKDEIVTKNIDNIQENKQITTGKEIANKYMLNYINTKYPDLYKDFKDMKWDDWASQLSKNKSFLNMASDTSDTTYNITSLSNPEATISISPNQFYNNMTTILNSVAVGTNSFEFGKTFNAFTFFYDGDLTSGISKLYTMGYPLEGSLFLDQNQLVPQNSNGGNNATQNIAGYQSAHSVFANMPISEAGNGLGYGLFTRANTAKNVFKLSVTSPEEFDRVNSIFLDTMVNSKEVSIWGIATNNLLNNITNIILDNTNTNIRDCLNGGLYIALVQMQTPTSKFNIGDSVQITTPTLKGIYSPDKNLDTSLPANVNKVYMDSAILDSATSAVRLNLLSSPFLVSGSNTLPRINTSKKEDIYWIIHPNLYVQLMSGTLTTLFNYNLQAPNHYIDEDHIFFLYKKPTLPISYMNPSTGLSANLIPITMDDEFISQEDIIVLTKPADVNMWNATYGYEWNYSALNDWGAGMVTTHFLHYLIYGGVSPWTQGFRYHSKGLLVPLATNENQGATIISYDANKTVNFSTQPNPDPSKDKITAPVVVFNPTNISTYISSSYINGNSPVFVANINNYSTPSSSSPTYTLSSIFGVNIDLIASMLNGNITLAPSNNTSCYLMVPSSQLFYNMPSNIIPLIASDGIITPTITFKSGITLTGGSSTFQSEGPSVVWMLNLQFDSSSMGVSPTDEIVSISFSWVVNNTTIFSSSPYTFSSPIKLTASSN